MTEQEKIELRMIALQQTGHIEDAESKVMAAQEIYEWLRDGTRHQPEEKQ